MCLSCSAAAQLIASPAHFSGLHTSQRSAFNNLKQSKTIHFVLVSLQYAHNSMAKFPASLGCSGCRQLYGAEGSTPTTSARAVWFSSVWRKWDAMPGPCHECHECHGGSLPVHRSVHYQSLGHYAFTTTKAFCIAFSASSGGRSPSSAIKSLRLRQWRAKK